MTFPHIFPMNWWLHGFTAGRKIRCPAVGGSCQSPRAAMSRSSWWMLTRRERKHEGSWWFYDDFMMILWWFYDDFMMILWWFYDDFMMILWWFYDDFMMILWWFYDDFMMILWWFYDDFMMILWWFYDDFMMILWWFYDDFMMILWWFYDDFMMILWWFYDDFLMILWWFYDDFLMILWWFYDDFMMILWWFYDDFMMILWWFYDDFMMILWWFFDDFMMILWRFRHAESQLCGSLRAHQGSSLWGRPCRWRRREWEPEICHRRLTRGWQCGSRLARKSRIHFLQRNVTTEALRIPDTCSAQKSFYSFLLKNHEGSKSDIGSKKAYLRVVAWRCCAWRYPKLLFGDQFRRDPVASLPLGLGTEAAQLGALRGQVRQPLAEEEPSHGDVVQVWRAQFQGTVWDGRVTKGRS